MVSLNYQTLFLLTKHMSWIYKLLHLQHSAFFLLLLLLQVPLSSNGKLFLTGIFLWSLIPVIGEGAKYSQDQDASHLVVMALFFALAILTAPSKLSYNNENLAATHLAKKLVLPLFLLIFFKRIIF